MLNPFQEVNWRPGLREKRKFAVSLMVGFPSMALVLFVARGLMGRGWEPMFPGKLAAVGFVVGLTLWLCPFLAKPFYVVWYFLACCIGVVVGNLMLVLLYYGVVTVLGFLVRLLGRSLISKGFTKGTPTYWQKPEPVLDYKRYYRQF